MTRQEVDRTQVIRDWLDEGTEQLSPRVRDHVLHAFPTTGQDTPFWAAPVLRMGSFAVGAAVGAASVALLVVLIGTGLFFSSLPGGTGTTPTATPAVSSPTGRPTLTPSPTPDTVDRSYRDIGSIGIPPRGAAPSDPTETELIEVFFRHSALPYKGAAFLYADGRLIWNEYFGSEQQDSTGWLEQSLSDEGIVLVRALATKAPDDVLRVLRPEELPSLLPARAWGDQTVRPYVPTEMAACLFLVNNESPFAASAMTLAEKLAALPPAVGTLLRDRRAVVSLDAIGGDPAYGTDPPCLRLDVADARRLEAALRSAGYEQDAWRNRYLLEYHSVIDRPEAGTWWLSVWFEPILPDGTITCSSCG